MRQDLNPRPFDHESSMLSTRLDFRPFKMLLDCDLQVFNTNGSDDRAILFLQNNTIRQYCLLLRQFNLISSSLSHSPSLPHCIMNQLFLLITLFCFLSFSLSHFYSLPPSLPSTILSHTLSLTHPL